MSFYGGGKNAAKKTIIAWHPEYDEQLAMSKGIKLIKKLKGVRNMATGKFSGGIASATFNKMQDLMLTDRPSTPVLNTAPSKAMWPQYNGRGLTPGLWTMV